MGLTLLIIPIVYFIFLTVFSKEITSRKFKKRFESMYEEIHNYRSKHSKYYIVVSMLRRLGFAMIPSLFYNYDYMKV